jgi:hydroxyacylglutathione hydrolase
VIEVVPIDTQFQPRADPRPVWVHCQGCYRASIAASLLHAAGHEVTALDGGFHTAAAAGVALSQSRPHRAA